MIQPLRAAHRRTFVALAFALPVILVVGLGSRHPRPGPRVLPVQVPASAHLVGDSDRLWQRHAIRTQLYADSADPQNIYVVLQPVQELNEPDLLFYWASSAPQGNALAAGAQLVGAYTAGKVFLLPLHEKRTGHLVLFSPAHQAVFDTAKVENLP
jgi:hypothetical protein